MNKRILPILLAASFSAAIAAPTAPVVVSGQATFAQQGNVFSITNTPNAIINWQSFNIAPGEITRFIQQNADSAVLNRITGQDPSQILGALQSNGHVFLINPNGIMFGKDARIDVNGLTASTLNISNADFIAGKRNFASGGTAGAVVNQGTITTPNGGSVFLIAPNVQNSGIVTAPNGQVVLAAGHTVQLVDSGNPDLHVVVSAPADQAINLGQVIAQGGRIGIYGALVNQRGIVNANSAVVGANGKIVLKASRDTLLEQGSVTTATGAGTGGDIRLLGERVGLTGDAQVDASGATGGGSALVGGDYQGKNADQVAHAQNTWLGQGASIKADATHSGNGGKVVLWSDGATSAFGSISARGGSNGGHGGLVETSGHDLTVAGARVDTSATKGKRGSWLLDPLNITVGTTDDLVLSDASVFGAQSGVSGNISATTLQNATTDIELQATNNITFNSAVALGSGRSLAARAGNDINVNAALSTAGGSITLTAADPAGSGTGTGAVSVNSNVTATGGIVKLTGNRVTLGANTIVKSTGCSECAVEFKANQVQFDTGSSTYAIAEGSNSVVSYVPLTSSRPIEYGAPNATPDSGKLWLTSYVLGKTKASEVNIGSSATSGGITWSYTGIFDQQGFGNIVLDNTGTIAINNNLTMNGGTIVLANYGSGNIVFGNGSGSLDASNIVIRSNNVDLENAYRLQAGTITLDTYNPATAIQLGTGASDTAGLALTATELGKLAAGNLVIGSAGRTGSITVVGDADYTPSSSSGLLTVNNGTGVLQLKARLGNTGTNGSIILNSAGGDILDDAANTKGTLFASRIDINGTPSTDVSLINGGTYNAVDVLTGSNLGSLEMRVHGRNSAATTVGDGTTGLSTTGAGGIRLKASSSPLIVHNVIDADTGNVTLEDSNEADLTIDSGAIVHGANVNVSNFNNVTVNGNIAATGSASIDSSYGDVVVAGTVVALNDVLINQADNLTVSGSVQAGRNASLTNVSVNAAVSGTVQAVNDASINYVTGTTNVGGTLSAGHNATIGHAHAVQIGGTMHAVNDATVSNGTSVLINGILYAGHTAEVSDTDSLATSPAGLIYASHGNFSIRGNVGTVTAPLNTKLASLYTQVTEADAVINIRNNADSSGPLQVNGAYQFGGSSGTGSISIENFGAMNLFNHSADGNPDTIRTGAGKIHLETHSPLTISGIVRSVSGDIELIAGDGGELKVTQPGFVTSTSGNVSLTGGTIIAPAGTVVTTGTVTQHQNTTTPPPPPEPTVAECLATPSATGCGDILVKAKLACIADPSGPNCGALLPPLSLCKQQPSTEGCSAVLPKIAECIATPAKDGCSVVLPTAAVCAAHPTTEGCTVVNQCLADPKAPGCGPLLPAIGACIADKTLPGCDAVLPKVSECRANTTQQGCEVILPSLAMCKLAPKSPNCDVVLPNIGVCIADKTRDGCGAVLPTVGECVANRTAQGCEVVLPQLAACLLNPNAEGCVVVLPTIDECVVTPARAGCEVRLPSMQTCINQPATNGCLGVLPKIEACVANPTRTGCEAVLPKLSVCIGDKTRLGCSVVLPTMAECIGSPSLQGCSVILPALEQCAVNPNQQGCEAVLPKPDFCSTHPLDPTCRVVGGGTGDQKVQPANQVVALLQNQGVGASKPGSTTGTPNANDSNEKPIGKPGSGQTGGNASPDKTEGAKNVPATKTYCN